MVRRSDRPLRARARSAARRSCWASHTFENLQVILRLLRTYVPGGSAMPELTLPAVLSFGLASKRAARASTLSLFTKGPTHDKWHCC
jgi:hypothetical protein